MQKHPISKNETGYNPKLKEVAQQLRRDMTPQEKHLWYDYLKSYPIPFRRQRPIDRFVADFYCPQARLVIELDGGQHFTQEGLSYDEARTEVIERYGMQVLRFTNRDVDSNFRDVCWTIDQTVKARIAEKV